MQKTQNVLQNENGAIAFNRIFIFLLMIPIFYVFVIDAESVKEFLPDVINDGITAANQFFKTVQMEILDFTRRNFNF